MIKVGDEVTHWRSLDARGIVLREELNNIVYVRWHIDGGGSKCDMRCTHSLADLRLVKPLSVLEQGIRDYIGRELGR